MLNRRYFIPLVIFALFLFGNIVFGQLECSFIVDLSPPHFVPGTPIPPDGSYLDLSFICISYSVTDDLAGVDLGSIECRGAIHNARVGTVDSLFFTGPILCRNFDNCDSVVVRVLADDLIPDLGCSCPPNQMNDSFWFMVETCNSGPYVDSLWPADVILSCEDQMGVFQLLDSAQTCSGVPYEIDPTTISVQVLVSNGGIIYDEM